MTVPRRICLFCILAAAQDCPASVLGRDSVPADKSGNDDDGVGGCCAAFGP